MAQFDTYLKNLEELEGKIYAGGFDINKYLLSEKEVVKKLLSYKNPLLKKDDIDLMVDSEEDTLKKFDDKEERKAKRKEKTDKLKQQSKEEVEKLKQKAEEEKEKIREKIKELKKIYKEALKAIYEEAKKIKEEIRKAVFTLINTFKELTKELITALIQTVSSVSAVVVLVSAPPFNIPTALSLVLIVVDSYMKLVSKITNIALPLLSPTKKLALVTDKKNLSIVSTLLNVVVEGILALWNPINLLVKVIKALIEFIISLFKRKEPSIFRKATRKLRKLGYIRKIGPDPLSNPPFTKRGDRQDDVDVAIYSYDEDDVDEVKDLLDQFKLNGDGDKLTDKVVAYNLRVEIGGEERNIDIKSELESLNDLLTELDKSPNEVESSISETDEYSEFVYDILLPDGTKLINISEEGLDVIKNQYKVKFDQINNQP